MVAPVLPPLLKGKETLQAALAGMKNDLYVRTWDTEEGTGKRKHVVHHELHVNPASIALGAGGLAVAGGVGFLGTMLALRFGGKEIKIGERTRIFLVDEFDAEFGTKTVVDQEAWTETITQNDQWVEGHYIEGTPTGWLCRDDGSTITLDEYETGLNHWMASHKGHDVVRTYEKLWVDGYWTVKNTTVQHPAITHTETDWSQLIKSGTSVLMTKRGIPMGTFTDGDTTAAAIRQATKRSYGAVEGTVALKRSARVISTHPATRKRVWCTRYFYEFKAEGIAIEDKASSDKWWNPFD